MDVSNYNNILSLSNNESDQNKVSLILSETESVENLKSVPDPYYGGEEGFENIYWMLNNVCETIKKKLEKR